MDERPDVSGLVRAPGLAMVIVGVVGLAGMVAQLAFQPMATEWLIATFEKAAEQDPDLDEVVESLRASQQAGSSVGNFVALALQAALCGLVVWGGLELRRVGSRGIALAGAIAAMIPCCGPCCGVFFVFGLWAVTVLVKDEVRQAFAAGDRFA